MSHIELIENIDPPAPAQQNMGNTIVSPDGHWKISYHDKFEWGNGADGWRMAIFSDSQDVTDRFKVLSKFENGKGFIVPKFRPWSFDSRRVAFLTCESNPLLILDVQSSKVSGVGSGNVSSVSWAHDRDSLLSVQSDGIVLAIGEKQKGFNGWQPSDQKALVYWLEPSDHFVSVTGKENGQDLRVRFFDGADGHQLDEHEIEFRDTQTLVPHEIEVSWHSACFDVAKGILRLRVYRQVSDSLSEGKDDQWIGVKFVV